MLLLSFYRRVTQLQRAKEICFRFHQKLVRKQDVRSSPALFPSASPGAERLSLGAPSQHEGSIVLVQCFLIAHPLLHPAPFIQFGTVNPSRSCSLVHNNFYNVTVRKIRTSPSVVKKESLEHLGMCHLPHWWKSIGKSDFSCCLTVLHLLITFQG